MTTWIANAERCQRMDQRASQEFGIPGDQLMERAGKLVFEAMVELLPDGGSLTVLCGKGNNGGDGFVVARLAHEQGYGVECLVAAQGPEDLTPLCALQFERAVAAGVTPHFASDATWTRRLESIPCRDLVIDALLGTGVTGPVRGPILEAIEAVNRSGTPVVSVDIPSGVHTDTGEELGASIWALRTVTIGLPKPCLFQGIGIEHSGFWTVADIGYPAEVLREPTEAFLVDEQWVGQFLPERFRASHKGSNGHTLIVAGSHWMPGSAVLAAKAAVRAGAGLVTVASVPSVCQAVMAQVPEAILLPLPEVDGVIAPAAADVIRNYPRRFQSALFGPGITHQAPVREFLQRVWENWEH
ncbi:MAG: NAD(P)H-hydrate epimerase, partial [Fimbriimonadaceae bacterium]